MNPVPDRICGVIRPTAPSEFAAAERNLADDGAGLVEFRLDGLEARPSIADLLSQRQTAVVVSFGTAPPTSDSWFASPQIRADVLGQAIDAGAEFVDLDQQAAALLPRRGAARRIVSHFDLEGTPTSARLSALHRELVACDADIVRIAATARSVADCPRLLELCRCKDVPTLAYALGPLGTASRIVGLRFGAPFSYGFARAGNAESGMPAYDDLSALYRCRSINAETSFFAVIGDPVKHSLSPAIHNAGLHHLGVNAVYLPCLVPRGTLQESLDALESMGIDGFSVTIPHKTDVVDRAPPQRRGPVVTTIGAANTLYRDEAGEWCATNTDYDAALQATLAAMQPEADETNYARRLEGRRVLMLGAGGAARAIGLGVVRAGGELFIANRTTATAEALARELSCRSVPWSERQAIAFDLLINTTSIGMWPDVDATPMSAESLPSDATVFEVVYNPEETRLVRDARERGCRVALGSEMFVRQAALQFRLFTGQAAPRDVFWHAFREGMRRHH